MTNDIFERVDRLLHDAERAHGGADFAHTFMRDEKSARELTEKRDRLIREALDLDPRRLYREWNDTILAPYIVDVMDRRGEQR